MGHSGERNSRLPQWMSCHNRARRPAKTIGLLGGVLADQLKLAQGDRYLRLGFGGQALEQFFGAFQTEPIDRHFKIFSGLGHAAMSMAVGFANHAQGKSRAVLHQFGDVSQRTTVISDGFADLVVTGLRNRQAYTIEKLDPAFERGWFWRWDVRFVSHGCTRSLSALPVPGAG